MKKLATRFMSMTMILIAMFCFCAQPAFAQNSTGRAPYNNRAHAYMLPQSNQVRSLTSDALICVGGTDISHFTLGTPTAVTSYGVTAPVFTNSAEYYNGVYYYANSTNGDFGTIDPTTGTMTQITTGNNSASIAYNPSNGQMYGISLGSSAVLYTIDPATGAETQVIAVNSTNFILGMTITNDGRILVIDAEIDGISELNPTTGDLTTVVAPGFTVNYGQDMAMDRETNTPYWAAYNATAGDGELYSIDLSAGTATLIGSFGDQVSGFATATIDNPNIAGAPTNFTVTPGANHALTATITWTNPTQTIGGTALTSITSVELYRGSTLLNSFSNPTVGGAMSFTDNTVPADGIYNYRAYAVTSEGNGVAASATANIGNLCDINFLLMDEYGDGWNGASIGVYNGSQLLGNVTCSSDSVNTSMTVPVGNYSFVWNSGSWDGECSFTISDNYGYIIYSGEAPEAGQFATFNNTCAALPTSLNVSPDTLATFLAGIGNPTAGQVISINGWMLNSNIVVSVAAPFEVSADDSVYAATATLPYVAGANTITSVYVRYNPTTVGTQTGVVTLTSGSVSATVAVEGTAISCDPITTYPYTCTFEPDGQEVLCWETVDVDNNADGNNGHISFMAYSDENTGCAVYFYDEEVAANDWLISPEFTLNGNYYASFDYLVASSSYPETFSVYVIPQGQTYATATQVLTPISATNADFATQRIGLGAYNGQTVRVAIHVESSADQYYIVFDNFTVDAVPAAELEATPDTLTFTGIAGTATAAQAVQVTSWSLTENVTVTATAPFEVSADGTTFGATAALAYVADDYTDVALYVRYNPTVAGTDNDVVTLTSTGSTTTIVVTGTAVDCSGVEALPFTEDFEDELTPCWQNIDVDGDGNTWYNGMESELEAYNGSGCYVSASYINYVGALTPDNWLITPAIAIPAEGGILSWYVAAQDASYPEDYYKVMVSTGNSTADFTTTVFDETLASGDWEQRTVNLSAFAGQNVYIAFVHTNSTDNYIMKIDDINIVAGGVGIEENEANAVRVFPNPVTNMINVEAQGFEQYQLVNMLGQNVKSSKLVNGNAQINVSNLSNGVYFVRLMNGSTVETIKVIKK